jgi:7-carboxy-7-deazaguanine synthase
MSKLRLVKNGIFPILYNHLGQKLEELPDTGIALPGTVQGEGKMAGIPVLFIRTSGCNLRCAWSNPDGSVQICDTPYSSFDTRNAVEIEIGLIIDTILANRGNIRHLVISGGEPYLQRKGLGELTSVVKLKTGMHITVETNATIFDEEASKSIDFFSLSPKLRNSLPTPKKLATAGFRHLDDLEGLHLKRCLQPIVMQQFLDYVTENPAKEFQLKFVVAAPFDSLEIEEVLKNLKGWSPEDILIMPAGRNEAELIQTIPVALEMSLRNGWRYCPRLHIQLFGDKPGT